jgi:hypothetical protein
VEVDELDVVLVLRLHLELLQHLGGNPVLPELSQNP